MTGRNTPFELVPLRGCVVSVPACGCRLLRCSSATDVRGEVPIEDRSEEVEVGAVLACQGRLGFKPTDPRQKGVRFHTNSTQIDSQQRETMQLLQIDIRKNTP
jgi:hypothetical protein